MGKNIELMKNFAKNIVTKKTFIKINNQTRRVFHTPKGNLSLIEPQQPDHGPFVSSFLSLLMFYKVKKRGEQRIIEERMLNTRS